MSHRAQVEVLKDVQRLHQHRALRPCSLTVNLVSKEADLDWGLVLCLKVGERIHV